jgi:hypothetical protein
VQRNCPTTACELLFSLARRDVGQDAACQPITRDLRGVFQVCRNDCRSRGTDRRESGGERRCQRIAEKWLPLPGQSSMPLVFLLQARNKRVPWAKTQREGMARGLRIGRSVAQNPETDLRPCSAIAGRGQVEMI